MEVTSSESESASGEALPAGWVGTTFGELFDFKGGSQPPKKEFRDEPGDGLIRLLQIRDFASDQYPVYIKDADKWPKCETNDIMIARYGASLGRVLTGMEGAYNVALIRMIFDKVNLDTGWVRYFLKSDHFQAPIRLLSRSAQNGFNKKEVAPIRVELPPLAEQSRIVSAIESLQKRSSRARDLLSEVGPLIGQLRQSVLRAAFSGRLTAAWREQNPDVQPASELLTRIRTERRQRWEAEQLAKYEAKGKKPPKNWQDKYKEPEPVDESELPKLPEGWCWVAVEEISEWVKDGTHYPPKTTSEGIPFIGIRNVINGRIDWSTIDKWVAEETHAELTEKYPHRPGEVLYTAVGATFGRAFPIEDDRKFIFQRHIAHIKPLQGISDSFLIHALNSPDAFAQAKTLARGAAQPTVTLGDLKRIAIPLCPPREQPEVVHRVDQAMQQLSEVESGLASMETSLTQLDQSILSKAFRGELVPQDPSDEPASQLLARIREKRQATSNKRR
ncbi:restriction endonuclease subunit S [Roseiconus lacunae]|uniref:Restriction endonuclease subunit S n=1 Tax=Roseiconus lacunae TaxID=2605694 RepID=A0ABT7PS32_9BACT|nr:restriction endonuclease subunit S [Roseiconus lacunae]MDM4019317.1 restriction endonuclease subunit S [Roseiconus lacunae]